MLHHPQNWINWSKLKTEDQHSTNLPPPQNSSDIIDEDDASNNNSGTTVDVVMLDVETATDHLETLRLKLVKAVANEAVEGVKFKS